MKNMLFLMLLIFISGKSYSQKELNNSYRSVPSQDPNNNIFISPPQNSIGNHNVDALEKPNSVIINADGLFKDTTIYKTDANTPGIFYKRNQYLGDFRTKTSISTIRYRDAAFVDGDKIKVHLNDKIIKPEVTLDGEFQGFKINLIKGINKIDFEALDEGFASPNTAEFEVYDDNGLLIESSQWNVGTGYKATIILYKE